MFERNAMFVEIIICFFDKREDSEDFISRHVTLLLQMVNDFRNLTIRQNNLVPRCFICRQQRAKTRTLDNDIGVHLYKYMVEWMVRTDTKEKEAYRQVECDPVYL